MSSSSRRMVDARVDQVHGDLDEAARERLDVALGGRVTPTTRTTAGERLRARGAPCWRPAGGGGACVPPGLLPPRRLC